MKNLIPDRKTSEEERFQDDYYSYFEAPENVTRYTPAAGFLDNAFPEKSFSLLDLGCGNGALSKYLPARCDYLGVDHSELAIEQCLKLYPNRNFIAKDLSLFLSELANENQKFHAVVLAGLLFHSVDKETQEKKDDQEIIQFCLDKILSDNGYLVIIVPFCYGNHPSHSLFVRAEWLQKSVEKMLEVAKAKIVHENISIQVGLEKKVQQQKAIPDWFVADSSADYSSIFVGTYMASWTFIASPAAIKS
ncbi:class I SAM-dependent methyltransferase [Komarekiella sp. 'clone 1']|uniref:Class I SAM-dependent methyltransferase n=1 Tax=Komarekiella delphini-convector SJRDD-AB1 TaxID=2593771 RepID=A0AA40SVK6_9NOST|nr:class I SAM-dependent methyltransferase [Komarekiella delphini-convector]MBD6616099.1 class I SAM-dependent methyltransferase [Komarekiella delphini-convector SJRDD-AB1]